MRSLGSPEEALNDLGTDITVCVIRVNEKRQRDNSINADAHGALEVVTLSVLNEVVDNQDGDEEDDGFEALEVQRHGLVHDPTEDDEEGSYEEGDLHGAADGDVDSQIHLSFVSDNDGRDVFGSVADDGYENETDECLADMCGFNNRVDAVDKELGANGDHDGHDNKGNTSGGGRENLALLLLVLASLVLNIGKQVVVRVKLEVEVQDVEDEQDNRGAVGEDEDVVVSFGVAGLAVVHDSVESGGDDERGGCYSHQRRHGGCDRLVEAALLFADATSEETATEDLA
jgi:hypothetical protein